jgi:phosphate/sulfate permease
VLGAAFTTGAFVNFSVLSLLVISWVVAPLLSYFLGKLVFKLIPGNSKHFKTVIIVIMIYSAFVLGLNDVTNAASSLVASGFEIILAKSICGFSMPLGMIIWGSRLVRRVGKELVELDYKKAVAAQLTKSIIISSLNVFGLNTSMNQTIMSALASMGARKAVLRSVILGWIYSPLIGFVTAYLLSLLFKFYGL